MGADTAGVPVVIDLGMDRGEPTAYHRGGQLTPSWFAPALIAALLLFSVTASGPPPPPPLAALLRVVIGPGDPYVVADTGQLVVQAAGELTAYDLETGERQWRVAQAVPTYRLRTGDGLLLLRPWGAGNTEPGTTAVSLRDGAQQWHNERSVVSLDGTGLMFAVDGVRSQSFGTGRRVERAVEALDPDGGLARWRLWVPSTAVLLSVPAPAGASARILLVRDDATAHLYDGRTGALLAVRDVPAANYDPGNPVVAGDQVLLRHPGPSGIEVTAYDPATLRPMWTEPSVGTLEIVKCGELACLVGLDGVRAIDPATGDARWHRPGWRSVETVGDRVVAYADGPQAPTGLVDPATGRLLVDVTGWRLVGGITGGGEVLVTRDIAPGPRTMVAVAAPGLSRPRLLAELPAGTRECQAAPERLICRSVYGELIVWSYRTEAG
ncbi:PQQ-binding-like beta-propeller repeat protein [Actinoplanes sp. NEAU-A12]|uniref:PQQ-binding-like beta-propeller repeat protein n=1 Tax=Actinoplanes sandaracinus TaxID=3045177 RepID=A0ABT6WU44_9ACTN|nr:PQQ-binding-like beta-propeller repeat protein [Actinoplanes sandaracinus]MDI6103270.1 PQQ-binding-like beta-propeller repeat protein [Actinoplanes sandaracinus]